MWGPVKSRQPGAHPAVADAEWAGSVTEAATADVRDVLRAARRRRRGRWLAAGLVVVAVGALVTLMLETGAFEPTGEPVTRSDGDVPAVAASGGAPMLDLAKPFDSTPAAHWRDGAAGIVPPPPEAVNGFSASEVAAATSLVREVLIASRLDQRMLVRHDPTSYLELLAPDARRQLEPLFGGGREPEVQSLVSLVATGNTLLPVEAKVDGEMRVAAGDAGELVVHTNYVFVYAFQPAGPTRLVDAMNVIVVVRADVDYVLRTGDRWTPGSRGLWYDDATGYGYSIGCDAYRKGFLAPAVTERAVTAGSPREPARFFDPSSALPPVGGCRG